jgi:hypothetical protein
MAAETEAREGEAGLTLLAPGCGCSGFRLPITKEVQCYESSVSQNPPIRVRRSGFCDCLSRRERFVALRPVRDLRIAHGVFCLVLTRLDCVEAHPPNCLRSAGFRLGRVDTSSGGQTRRRIADTPRLRSCTALGTRFPLHLCRPVLPHASSKGFVGEFGLG